MSAKQSVAGVSPDDIYRSPLERYWRTCWRLSSCTSAALWRNETSENRTNGGRKCDLHHEREVRRSDDREPVTSDERQCCRGERRDNGLQHGVTHRVPAAQANAVFGAKVAIHCLAGSYGVRLPRRVIVRNRETRTWATVRKQIRDRHLTTMMKNAAKRSTLLQIEARRLGVNAASCARLASDSAFLHGATVEARPARQAGRHGQERS